MPRIYVDFDEFRQMEPKLKNAASKINSIQAEFQRTVQQLDWDVRYQSNINNTAGILSKKIQGYSKALNDYQQFLDTAYNEYLKLDVYDRGLEVQKSSNQDKEHLKNVNSLYGLLTGLYGQMTGDLDGKGWKLGGALFSAFGLWLGSISNDAPKTRLELFRQFETMMGSEVSIVGKVLKAFKKNELSSAYSLAGSGLSIVGELSKYAEYTVPESLKKMGGLIDKGGTLGKSIFDTVNSENTAYKTKMVSDANRDDLAAVKAMFSMGTYFVGDVMERSADGRYDINDYGGTLLETGINGMSSVVRSYTGGIVKLDADRAATIYNGVTNRVTDWIKNTNAPLPVQVALVAPGAVISASVSTVAVFIDHGMQIGEKIKDVVNWFKGSTVGASGGGFR